MLSHARGHTGALSRELYLDTIETPYALKIGIKAMWGKAFVPIDKYEKNRLSLGFLHQPKIKRVFS